MEVQFHSPEISFASVKVNACSMTTVHLCKSAMYISTSKLTHLDFIVEVSVLDLCFRIRCIPT